MRHADWNAKTQRRPFTQFLRTIVYGVGVMLAIGALFGCFNTMYSAVGARSREIATLRALGYGGFAGGGVGDSGSGGAVGGRRPDRRGLCLGAL